MTDRTALSSRKRSFIEDLIHYRAEAIREEISEMVKEHRREMDERLGIPEPF